MAEKERTYFVTITVIEGRHYIWDNMNSAVIVKVDKKKKFTAVKKFTDSPFYNEYFVFELNMTYDKLLEKNIILTVIQPRTFCRRQKILGSVKMDIATVVTQKNSQFYHKWAILTSSQADSSSGPTGYLKVDIAVLSRGQTPKLPLNVFNDEIEGNLLAPLGFVTERQKARFVFNVYRCEHLSPKPTPFVNSGLGKQNGDVADSKLSAYVAITFAGTTVYTSVRKNTQNPIFNEKLAISDLFPPLCQRIKVEVCFEGMKKINYALHNLNLKNISNDTVEGFLPTFGPAYIYLYSKQDMEDYCGTILMSMRTELSEDLLNANLTPKLSSQQGIISLQEETIFSFEKTFLFATIFEANCILKKYHDKTISFKITFGNIRSETAIEGDPGEAQDANAILGQKPLKTGKNFYYLDYAEKKPCMRLTSRWPDFRKRMYHSNILEKISKSLKLRLEQIEEMFTKQNSSYPQAIAENLKEATDFLFASAKKYVEILSTSYNFNYGSDLDKERTRTCLTTMNSILDKLPSLQSNKSKKFVYRYLEDFQMRIAALVEDAQACWPDVFLWMICANKKIAYLRIPAREIVFSPIEEELGEFTGKLRPMLFLLKEKNVVICKVEVLMWLGLENQKRECFDILPSGFRYEGRQLVAEETHLFEGKAYIFKGEVVPGFDESGLVDPFVHVSLGHEMKSTQLKRNVLVPLWDETLIFYNINLYGSEEHIKLYPPTILVQMFDRDPISVEFIGRKIIIPEIIFLHDSSEINNSFGDSSLIEVKNGFKLAYHCLYNEGEILGKILAAFRLEEISEPAKVPAVEQIITIPNHIKPRLLSYRIEVLFWGVRNLKKVNLIRINRPKIVFYCTNLSINSPVIENAANFSNFINNTYSMDLNMPCQEEFSEAFQFKLIDSRKFGVNVFAGISVCDTSGFLFYPMTIDERNSLLNSIQINPSGLTLESITNSDMFIDNWTKQGIEGTDSKPTQWKCLSAFIAILKNLFSKKNYEQKFNTPKSGYSLLSTVDEENEEGDFDWWTKFYASIGELPTPAETDHIPPSHQNKLKVYPNELENQAEFRAFSDILTTFEIFKGKRTGDNILDEQLTTAIFKGSVRVYQWPPEDGDIDKYVTSKGTLVKSGVFVDYPPNTPIQYVLRIYCIRAINLRPSDPNGLSDPYIEIKFGQKRVSNRDNYIPESVNPIFGRCFEFQSYFPENTSVLIRIMDYDKTSEDDLIGETKIDLENRFYTKHRAFCGIAESYFTSGYCQWRDQKKPTEILDAICRKWGLDDPEYNQNSICINSKEFVATDFRPSDDPQFDREKLALEVLKRWQEMPVVGFKLVPEYVETRSLFTPDKPGIEQGKLQLWIDIFPRLDYPIPTAVNITPRKPIAYELRLIIWNTQDVILSDDDFFTGEKKSDIYVKGWLDDPSNYQCTDVHYRSLTGEGNFNWRFIFKFEYLCTENKLIVRKKTSVFSKNKAEVKLPCILNLTVWDNDTFSKDDFLGSLALELSRMPRGARSAKNCNMAILAPTAKKVNLFKIRRMKGWWPFRATDPVTQQYILGGKLEAELEILTKEDAELNPVGYGRQGPEELPPPKYGDSPYRHFLDHRKQVAFHYDEEIPTFKGNRRRSWFGCSNCAHCQSSRDCKIYFFVLVVVMLMFSVALILYFGGFLVKLDSNCTD